MLNHLFIVRNIRAALFQHDIAQQSALVEALHAEPGLDLLQVADSYRSASEWLRRAPPDVLVTDTRFADGCGIDIMRDCTHRHPKCSILVLSDSCDESTVFRSLEAGASGYILKCRPVTDLVNAVSELHLGGSPISPEIARLMLTRFRGAVPSPRTNSQAVPLTRREAEVLTMIGEGYSDKAVGEALAISCLTVQTHTKNIYRKLGVHSRTEALCMMRRQGYLIS